MKNTILLNGWSLIIGFPLTIILALLINDIGNKHFRKTVQTLSYLPYFISMVVVCGIVVDFCKTTGVLGTMMTALTGKTQVDCYLGNADHNNRCICSFKTRHALCRCDHDADLFALDCIFRVPTMKLIAEASKRSESKTYSYLFAYEFPVQNGKIAWHCSDIPFVFNNVKRVPSANIEGVSEKLEEQVFSAVMTFARTGNPNNDKLPTWDASKENDEATMVFDRECECRHNFDHKLVPMGREAFFKYGQFAFGNIQH